MEIFLTFPFSLFLYVFVKMNYKVKNVSVKTDLKGNPVGYSIIVCPKTNEEYTTSFFYTIEDAKSLGINNKDQAMALVGQSCQILKTLKLA